MKGTGQGVELAEMPGWPAFQCASACDCRLCRLADLAAATGKGGRESVAISPAKELTLSPIVVTIAFLNVFWDVFLFLSRPLVDVKYKQRRDRAHRTLAAFRWPFRSKQIPKIRYGSLVAVFRRVSDAFFLEPTGQ